jgi:hypothetical protein
MRLRDDLLPTAQGMAGSGRVGDAPQDALEPPRRSRQDRLVENLARLGERGGTRGAKRQAPIPPIVANRTPSATLWSTVAASP